MNKFFRSGGHKLLFAFLFAAIVFAVQALPASAQLNKILKKVDDHRKDLHSLRADIKMAKYDPVLEETTVSEGKLMFGAKTKQRDYLLRIDWRSPRTEILAIAKGKYIAYNPNTKQAFTGTANSKEAVKKGGNALSFMNMSKAELENNYSATYLGEEKLSGNIPTWHLKFTPKAKADYKSAEIWVDGEGMIIQARLTPNSGDESIYRLTNLEKNLNLDSSQFVVNLPGNVKIIKS